MFIDKHQVGELGYIALLLTLNATQREGFVVQATDFLAEIIKVAPRSDAITAVEELRDLHLLHVLDSRLNEAEKFETDGALTLSWLGLAFLVNHANEYVKIIQEKRSELPEKLIATLVPYLNLRVVPAADRYVSVNDNRPDFESLIRDLELIRDEIARDENKNEYPIPEKRAVVAELDGVLAQLNRGYVKLSTLTTSLRSTLHNIAETCKDIGVIAGAATAAIWTIWSILSKLM